MKKSGSGNSPTLWQTQGYGVNVGIGTTMPGAALDVQSGALRIHNAVSASSTIEFTRSVDTWSMGSINVTHGGNYGGSLAFKLHPNNNILATAPIDVMYLRYDGNVGIGTTAPTAKLEVNGDVRVTGNMGIGIAVDTNYRLIINGNGLASGGSWISDQLFKTNIDSLNNVLSTINQLKPKSFYFDTTNVYGINFSNRKQYGFMAQDVETILPELVISVTKPADTLGNIIHPAVTYKALNYNAFWGILTKGIQELQQKNDSLETKNDVQGSVNISLQNQVNQLTINANKQDSINNSLQDQLNQLLNCCNGNEDRSMQSGTNSSQAKSLILTKQTDVELSNKDIVVLNQNVPNPFAEQTTISYYLPENVQRAQILFFEQSGKIIKAIDLTEKGKGQLNVFANDLTSGIYTYSLIVDGQIMETKKMIKAK